MPLAVDDEDRPTKKKPLSSRSPSMATQKTPSLRWPFVECQSKDNKLEFLKKGLLEPTLVKT